MKKLALLFAMLLFSSFAYAETIYNITNTTAAGTLMGINGNKLLVQTFTTRSLDVGQTLSNISFTPYLARDGAPDTGDIHAELWTIDVVTNKTSIKIAESNNSFDIVSFPTFAASPNALTLNNATFLFNQSVSINGSKVYGIVLNYTGVNTGGYWLRQNNLYANGSLLYTCPNSCTNATLSTWDFAFQLYGSISGTGGGTETVTFVNPTPSDAAHNDTQVIINMTSTNNATILWFGNTSSLTNAHKVLNMTSMPGYANYTTNVTAQGTYYYKASADNGTTNTTLRSWIFDTEDPDIILNLNNGFSALNESRTNQYQDYILTNVSLQDNIDLFGFSLNVTHPNGTSYFYYENTSLSGVYWNYSQSVNMSGWPNSTQYRFTYTASDAHTAKEIPEYAVQKRNRRLDFITEAKNEISIIADQDAVTNAIKEKDRYKFTFDFSIKGNRARTFDIFSDKPIIYRKDSAFKAHFIVWNAGEHRGNWLDFEGTQGTPTVLKISEYHYQVTFQDMPDKVTFNSIGGLNTNIEVYRWFKGQLTHTEPTPVFSTANFTILLNLTKDLSIADLFAGVWLNGTSYASRVIKYNGTNYTAFSASFGGISVTASTPLNLGWNVTGMTAGNGTNYSFFANASITLSPFSLAPCTAGNFSSIFTIFNEEIPSQQLNGTVEVNGEYWLNENANLTINATFASTPASLCVTPESVNLTGNLYIQYAVALGFTERWFLFNHSFAHNNESIIMGNFNTTSGISDLKITVRRIDTFAPFKLVVAKLQRLYVGEGVWRTVQMDMTGDFGLLFFNILEESTDYRLIYTDINNHVLKQTEILKFVCTSGVCEVTQALNPFSDVTSSETPIIQSSFNNVTKILTITWEVTSGNSVTIADTVTKETLTGKANICSSTATGAAGTITCNTTGYTGTFLVMVTQDGEPEYTATHESPEEKLTNFLDLAEQAFWTLGIMVCIIMFGAILGPAAVAISTVLGLIVVFFLGIFTPITVSFISVAVVLGLVVAIKVRT